MIEEHMDSRDVEGEGDLEIDEGMKEGKKEE